MSPSTLYLLLADSVLMLHSLFVCFVVLGLILIVAGGLRGWQWVHNPWFRLGHLLAIGIVVLQAWLGIWCPLTLLEMSLREKAGAAVYRGSFIAHWLDTLLFYQAPAWLFTIVYTLFGALVAAAWYWVRPSTSNRSPNLSGKR